MAEDSPDEEKETLRLSDRISLAYRRAYVCTDQAHVSGREVRVKDFLEADERDNQWGRYGTVEQEIRTR